jgi:hypothetical protein
MYDGGLSLQKERPPVSQETQRVKFLVELFSKSSRGVGAQPTDAAFLFCKAFFFVPAVAKKKALNNQQVQTTKKKVRCNRWLLKFPTLIGCFPRVFCAIILM